MNEEKLFICDIQYREYHLSCIYFKTFVTCDLIANYEAGCHVPTTSDLQKIISLYHAQTKKGYRNTL